RARALCFTGATRRKIPLGAFAIGSRGSVAAWRIRLARPIALHERLFGAEGRFAARLSTFAGIGGAAAWPSRLRAALARIFLVVVVHCGLCSFARLDNRIKPKWRGY